MPWTDPRDGTFPTLGYDVAEWIQEHLPVPDGELQGQRFILSDWQLRFLLHYYRLKPDAMPDPRKPSRAFFYPRGGQLVAPQKTGKGPFSGAIALAEAYGPVLFDGWDARGEPVGRQWATPYIQITGSSQDQAGNVWLSLYAMLTLSDLPHEVAADIGMTRINIPAPDARHGAQAGRIEPVTSSAKSRLGQRVTFAVQDETHNWFDRDGGRKLADTQRRNLAGMGGRFMETSNAWDPNEHSVAQDTFEKEPSVYKMFFPSGDGSIRNKRERMKVLHRLYDDSPWVDQERISEEIDTLLARGEIAQASRYFFNRVVPAEDHAFNARRWRELAWRIQHPDEPVHEVPKNALIVIGVDGARYEDSLAVIATEVPTGYQWVAGLWEKPHAAPDTYEHDFDEVDGVVTELFDTYTVWRLYGDPGSQTGNISPLIDRWQGRWTDKRVTVWAMNRPRNAALMIRRYVSAMVAGDVTHDGDERMARHIENARRKMVNAYDEDGRRLWTISKEAPGSPLKIDCAAAGALSWEARGDAISAGAKPKGGTAYPEVCDCGNPDFPHFKRFHATVTV